MGAELSSLIVEPLIGIGIIALAIIAIMQQNKGNRQYARWSVIGSIVLIILLIIINIALSLLV